VSTLHAVIVVHADITCTRLCFRTFDEALDYATRLKLQDKYLDVTPPLPISRELNRSTLEITAAMDIIRDVNMWSNGGSQT
jgi:hypothetical protein